MKNLLKILALACVLAVSARAQVVASTISFLGANPQWDTGGNLTACSFQVIFSNTATVSGKALSGQESVAFDASDVTRTVTVGTHTLTYAQVIQALALIATQEKSAAPGTQAKAAADAKAKP